MRVLGSGVGMGVAVGVLVGVGVLVDVGVLVCVAVGVLVGVGAMMSTVVVSNLESDVAVIIAVPVVLPEVKVAVATPLRVVFVTTVLPTSPRLVVKVTTVPLSTACPDWSLTVAVSSDVYPPTGILVGSACKSTCQGGPTMSTWVVPIKEPAVTVIFAVPGTYSALSVAVATPLQFVVLVMLSVVLGGGSKLPRSVVNVTILLHTGFSQESLTVAVMIAVSIPSAKIAVGARVTFSTAGGPTETVRFEVSVPRG